MKNSLLIIALLFSLTSLEARYKKHITKQLKGQEYYLKHCAACHGDGNRGGNLYSIEEWKTIFANNGKELIALHDGEDNIEQIMIYLKSDEFKQQNQNMLKFIQEFAYDSESIPTCY
jgi:cytochrome c553